MIRRRNRVRFLSLGVIGLSVVSLAAPNRATAAPKSECGVCYVSDCPEIQFRRYACEYFCNTLVADYCQGGIPGGWVCEGSEEYADFWQCLGNA